MFRDFIQVFSRVIKTVQIRIFECFQVKVVILERELEEEESQRFWPAAGKISIGFLFTISLFSSIK